ncbi:hypothetical protein KCP76_08135 [Salmonella enterica subsp. enterica serovar Weltevreden]|nr:hypothetical protein KCP76_08135 [Salmonella enterica subsp. enterica serovar Weltevreden]
MPVPDSGTVPPPIACAKRYLLASGSGNGRRPSMLDCFAGSGAAAGSGSAYRVMRPRTAITGNGSLPYRSGYCKNHSDAEARQCSRRQYQYSWPSSASRGRRITSSLSTRFVRAAGRDVTIAGNRGMAGRRRANLRESGWKTVCRRSARTGHCIEKGGTDGSLIVCISATRKENDVD